MEYVIHQLKLWNLIKVITEITTIKRLGADDLNLPGEILLTPLAPSPQNCETDSNNSSATAGKLF